MSYKVTFHTEAYKSHRASKKNWAVSYTHLTLPTNSLV